MYIPHTETVEYVDLTPELAKFLLERSHPNQRPLSKAYVTDLAGAIKRNEFIASQQTLQIDSNNYFFNGQHTCHAVIHSGITVKHIKLEKGCDPRSFTVADSGRPRNQVCRFKAATGRVLAPNIITIYKVLGQSWGASTTSNKVWQDVYQRATISADEKYGRIIENIFGFTAKGSLKGFKRQPLAGVTAAGILAAMKYPERTNEIYRWVHIASTGQAPSDQDQALSALETTTAHKWFQYTVNPHYDKRDTMNHFRRSCYAIHCYMVGQQPKELKRLSSNPLLK